MQVYSRTSRAYPDSLWLASLSRKSRYFANLRRWSILMRSLVCLKLAQGMTILRRMQGCTSRTRVAISGKLECREQGTMQLIWSGAWCSSMRKSVSMQMKLPPRGPRFVRSTTPARSFLLIRWMKPCCGSVVRKSVRRLASSIFFSCFSLTTIAVWKYSPSLMRILCFPRAPMAMQTSFLSRFFSMMSIILAAMAGSLSNLKKGLQYVLSKIISSILMEMPLSDSTTSCLSFQLRRRGGKSMGFSFTMAYSYLKSPVKRTEPMCPRKRIMADPGMCLASKKVTSTLSSPSTSSTSAGALQSWLTILGSLGYLWSRNLRVWCVVWMGPQSHSGLRPSQWSLWKCVRKCTKLFRGKDLQKSKSSTRMLLCVIIRLIYIIRRQLFAINLQIPKQ